MLNSQCYASRQARLKSNEQQILLRQQQQAAVLLLHTPSGWRSKTATLKNQPKKE
jgi:hypothetical protein